MHEELWHLNIQFYTTIYVSHKGGKSVLIMKETLWKNNLSFVKKYTHDLHKFHYNHNYSCRKKIGITFSPRFMYLPNSWNNLKINCNRKAVFTHFITTFPKSRTTVIPWSLTPQSNIFFPLIILDSENWYFLQSVLCFTI